jgi:hypothetical protein
LTRHRGIDRRHSWAGDHGQGHDHRRRSRRRLVNRNLNLNLNEMSLILMNYHDCRRCYLSRRDCRCCLHGNSHLYFHHRLRDHHLHRRHDA